jgi:hypothetical protein
VEMPGFMDITNPLPSGFFPGSTNVDANHGIFTEIAGNLNIKVKIYVCYSSYMYGVTTVSSSIGVVRI